MKIQYLAFCLLATLTVSCNVTPPLNSTKAAEIRDTGSGAIAGSVSFLRGAPITYTSSRVLLQSIVRQNPRVQAAISPTMQQALAGGRVGSQQLVIVGTACGPNNGLTDADSDGIYANLSYEFNCTGTSGVLKGKVTVRDDNDNDSSSGYSFKFEDLRLTSFSNNQASSVNFNQDVKVTKSSSKYTIAQTYSFDATVLNGGAPQSGGLNYNGNLEYTPDSPTSGFNAGTIKYDVKFGYYLGGDAQNYSMSTNNLKINQFTCSNQDTIITSGKISFGESTNKVNWTSTGCFPQNGGYGTWDYNGSPI